MIAQCAAVNTYADSDQSVILNDSFISYQTEESQHNDDNELEIESETEAEIKSEAEFQEKTEDDAWIEPQEEDPDSVIEEASSEDTEIIPETILTEDTSLETDDIEASEEDPDAEETLDGDTETALQTRETEYQPYEEEDTESSNDEENTSESLPEYPEDTILQPEDVSDYEAETIVISETASQDAVETAGNDEAADENMDVIEQAADTVTETEVIMDTQDESVLLDAYYYSTPAAPTSFTVTALEDTAVLKWTKASNVTGYRIQMYNCKTKQSTWLIATQKRKYTVTGLKLGQSYKFRLLAYKQYGTENVFGKYSKWIKIKAEKIDPKKPKNLEAKGKDSSVKLTWNAGKHCNKYLIEVLDPKTNKIRKAGRTDATTFTVTGLVNNKHYKFRVTGYSKVKGQARYSPSTKWLSVTPNALGSATASGWNKSVYLNWPKVSGASKYVIFSYNPNTKKLHTLKTRKADKTEYKVTNLKNGKTYSFVIKVYKDGKVHSTSPVLTATTFVPRKEYIKTAKEYEGAIKGSDKHKEIIDIYNSQDPVPVSYKVTYYDDWCAAFATAMAVKANVLRMIPGECSCTRQIALWKARGQYVSGNKYVPSPGDLIYYDWNPEQKDGPEHVGIVIAVKKNQITTIEGNTGSPSSVGIRYRTVGYKHIYGYGVPNGK